MGAKGTRTRRRLIDTTTELLGTVRLQDLRVADIARTAGVSPATFYLYFTDVSDVVLAAIGELSQSTPAILALIDGNWSAPDARERARRVVEEYIEFWDAHRTVFRVRNLAAEEGDQRFVAARQHAIRPLLMALAQQISRGQEAGRVDRSLHPSATAGVLLAMLERIAAVLRSISVKDIEPEHLLDSAAYMLATTLGAESRTGQ